MDALIQHPIGILSVFLLVLATLFGIASHPKTKRIFNFIPLLVFAYFVPTALSNLGVIPIKCDLYDFIKTTLLPASLVLLTLSVDIPAVLRLGKPAVVLFLTATLGIVIGGPLAYLLLGGLVPAEMGDQAWRGLAALSGSWIGGGANFVAIGESVGATEATIGLMVVVDVAIANLWMAVLLFWAGRDESLDARIGADRTAIETLRARVANFQQKVARPTTLPDLLAIAAIAFGGSYVATQLSYKLPEVGDIIGQFTWVVILVTTLGVLLSFTPVRRLEGAGASAVGSLFLYILVASIGAKAEFHKVGEAPAMLAIGAVWMTFHAVILLLVRWRMRAPIFFAAVGSKANVGGAASAPIVASAFHPALAPAGVLLAVAGYVLGTYAGLLCASLLRFCRPVS